MKNVNMTTAVRTAIQNFVSDIHTAIPAKVVKVNKTAYSVDVVPMVSGIIPQGAKTVFEKYMTIADVPVTQPSTKKYIISVPIEVGDTGLLLFTETDFSAWRASGEQSDPVGTHKYHLSNAVFLAGLYPDTDLPSMPMSGDLVIGETSGTGAKIVVSSGTVTINNHLEIK